MAKAKTESRPLETEPLMILNDEELGGDQRVEDKIRAEFNQSDSDEWLVKVSRFEGHGKQEPECFECTPADFPITGRLREEFGAGKYRVRVYKNSRCVNFFQYAIEAPKKNPVGDVKTEIATLAGTFQAALDRQSQMIERLIERRQPAQSGSNITELVEALVALKKLDPPSPPPADTSRDTLLEVFKLGLEARDGGGGGDSSPGILGFAERLLSSPIVQKIAEATMAAQPAVALPPPTRTAPQPNAVEAARAPRAIEPGPPDQAAQIQIFMQTQVAYLIGRASQWRASGGKMSNPDLYAEWVVDNIPAELLDQLLAAPSPVDALAVYVPELLQFRDWFDFLVTSIREYLTDQAEPSDKVEAGAANGIGTRPYVPGATGASSSESARGA